MILFWLKFRRGHPENVHIHTFSYIVRGLRSESIPSLLSAQAVPPHLLCVVVVVFQISDGLPDVAVCPNSGLPKPAGQDCPPSSGPNPCGPGKIYGFNKGCRTLLASASVFEIK